eukprot:5398780-Amphidinium_carterae.1
MILWYSSSQRAASKFNYGVACADVMSTKLPRAKSMTCNFQRSDSQKAALATVTEWAMRDAPKQRIQAKRLLCECLQRSTNQKERRDLRDDQNEDGVSNLDRYVTMYNGYKKTRL